MYVRWGHNQCPLTAQLVYPGRGGESNWNQPAMAVYMHAVLETPLCTFHHLRMNIISTLSAVYEVLECN